MFQKLRGATVKQTAVSLAAALVLIGGLAVSIGKSQIAAWLSDPEPQFAPFLHSLVGKLQEIRRAFGNLAALEGGSRIWAFLGQAYQTGRRQ